jgi:hypothetical protein
VSRAPAFVLRQKVPAAVFSEKKRDAMSDVDWLRRLLQLIDAIPPQGAEARVVPPSFSGPPKKNHATLL